MNRGEHINGDKSLIWLFVACLCGILLFFAVAAKVAGYRTQDQSVKPIAAMHIWQDSGHAPVHPGQPGFMPTVIALIACILLFIPRPSLLSTAGEPTITFQSWLSTDLSVRPPPAL